jgi:MFS family permease
MRHSGTEVGEMTEAEANGGALLGRMLGPYAVLRGNRNLQLLFGGQVVSSFGDWLYVVALVVLVYEITGSATVVAVLTFFRLLPYVLFLPFSGLLADRGNRKVLMIVADLGRGVCMLGLLFAGSEQTLWLAFPLVFLATVLSSLFRPAMNAVLPALVGDEDKLAQANGLWSQMESLSFILGPALGGVLVLLGEPRVAFLINGVTFLISALTLLFVRVPPRDEQAADGGEEEGWVSQTLAGFRFLLRENEGVLSAMIVSLVGPAIAGGAIWTLMVVLAEETFDLGGQGAGFLNAVYGAGALLGGLVVGYATTRFRLGPTFVWATGASAVIFALLGLSPAGALPFVLLVIIGVIDVFSEVSSTTILQSATPDSLLGRVFGAFEALVISAMLVGALIIGPLIDFAGPRAATVILGAAGLAFLLVSLPRLLRLEDAVGVRVFVQRVPVLSSLPHRALDDLASRIELGKVPEGTDIVREGDVGDRLYILKEGEAEVVARGEGESEIELATLSKNDYFGEIALLRDVPRTATVRSRGPVELYSLGREDFQELLERSEELKHAMTGTSDARYVETQNRLLLRR